jgi:hypothetical protein
MIFVIDGAITMKRLLFVALMVTCSFSWAEWEYFGEKADYADYVDKSTIRRNGAITKMWTLTDYFEEKTDSSGKNTNQIKHVGRSIVGKKQLRQLQ